MAKAIEDFIPTGLRDRARKAHLASDRRTGAHSRRQVRVLRRRWLQRHWQLITVTATLACVSAVGIHAFVWQPVAPYAIGALVTSVPWWIHCMMLETGGLATWRSGIIGEQSTADELRQLRREGWIVVNHVMLEWRDVDHVLLGPAGFLAIETKFKSEWRDDKCDLSAMAQTALDGARDVGTRLQQWKTDVQPIVVMWGPDISTCFPDIFEHQGVIFCPGRQLREHIRSLPNKLEADQVHNAFTFLDDYVKTRDPGEVHVSGEIPRTAGQVTTDLWAAGVAWIASMMAVLSPVSVSPTGAWSIAVATAGLSTAVFIRRRWSHSPRVQRVTTAIITTCAGLGVVFAMMVVIRALA